jgi:DNA repair photolyase
MTTFTLIDEKRSCYDLPGFAPLFIDRKVLERAGVDYPLVDTIDTQLIDGSHWFQQLFDHKSLTPGTSYLETLTDPEVELEIHNYTGICPTNVLEVSPSSGSCAVGCQYCLVTDGKHCKAIEVYPNYAEKLARSLERNRERELFYYFSPKTEAFSEPHLFNGLAHDIVRAFIAHYDRHPDSKVRIFIATKGGPEHLGVLHQGESIFDLLARIASKVQVNGSIGIMPPYLRDVLEPNAASIAARLETLERCRALGMWAESVLCQPLLLPYLTRETIDDYCRQLSAAGVRNIKPEFLTTEVRNLVVLAQFVNHFDPQLIGEFFYPYLHERNQQHIKQRSRLAPDKAVCVEKLALIKEIADSYGISISICNWVKQELTKEAAWVAMVDGQSAANGYRCLGYQTRLFA